MVYLGGFDFCQIFLSQSELKVLHEYKWMLLLLHYKNMFAFLCKTCIGWECDIWMCTDFQCTNSTCNL